MLKLESSPLQNILIVIPNINEMFYLNWDETLKDSIFSIQILKNTGKHSKLSFPCQEMNLCWFEQPTSVLGFNRRQSIESQRNKEIWAINNVAVAIKDL